MIDAPATRPVGRLAPGKRPRVGPDRPARRIYPRHRLDISTRDLLFAIAACAFAGDAAARERRLEGRLGPGEAIVCSSLRSGFELVLAALALPPGSEVLVSAITHPDMVAILERHRLVARAIDIDPATLAPCPELMAQAITTRTRGLLVAHLFGARIDLDATFDVARRHGLLVFEDCAQSFSGPGDAGDARADVSMFSFGSIKTSAALGGGVLYVRRPSLLRAMAALRRDWPRQTRRDYLTRSMRFVVLHALENAWVYGAFVRAGGRAGIDVDELVNRSVHALRPPAAGREQAFERWLHRRPSAPLLAVLALRLRTFDAERLERRRARGDELARRLPPELLHPGDAAPTSVHWIFPVVTADPDGLIAGLRAAGFDATRATTSICALRSGTSTAASTGQRLMAGVVFVPAYPELPRQAFERLVAALARGGPAA